MVKIRIEGEGLSIEKEVDEQIANMIIGLIFGLRKPRRRQPLEERRPRRKAK